MVWHMHKGEANEDFQHSPGCGPIPSQLDNFGQTKGGEHYKFSLLSIVLVCLVSYKKHKSSQDNAVAVKLGMIP